MPPAFRFVAALLILSFPPLSAHAASAPAHEILPENASLELVRQGKSIIFFDVERPLAEVLEKNGDGTPTGYRIKRSEWNKLIEKPYVLWKKPGFVRVEDGFVAQPMEKLGRGYDAISELRGLVRGMGSRVCPAGALRLPTEEFAVRTGEQQPRYQVDVFAVPSALPGRPMSDFAAQELVHALHGFGHFFSIVRAETEPPRLQEDLVYVRIEAGVEVYSLRGPALPVTFE